MIAFSWTATLLGLGLGTLVSALFFGGLVIGMRWALRSAKPVGLLVLSAILRIAMLIAGGWVVAAQFGPWAALGFALAFLAVRLIATTLARVDAPAKAAL